MDDDEVLKLDDLVVRQKQDGCVLVWRNYEDGSCSSFLSASPDNGKLKVETDFIKVSPVSLSAAVPH